MKLLVSFEVGLDESDTVEDMTRTIKGALDRPIKCQDSGDIIYGWYNHLKIKEVL